MITRKRWTTAPKAADRDGRKHTAVIHHTVSPNRRWTRFQEMDHLRQIRAHHVDGNGWSDIGYSAVLFPSARLYEARGLDRIPAAQANANTGTIAIAYVGDGRTADMTRRARLRLRVALINLRVRRRVMFLRTHRDFGGTECPGDRIHRRIQKLRRFTGLR